MQTIINRKKLKSLPPIFCSLAIITAAYITWVFPPLTYSTVGFFAPVICLPISMSIITVKKNQCEYLAQNWYNGIQSRELHGNGDDGNTAVTAVFPR